MDSLIPRFPKAGLLFQTEVEVSTSFAFQIFGLNPKFSPWVFINCDSRWQYLCYKAGSRRFSRSEQEQSLKGSSPQAINNWGMGEYVMVDVFLHTISASHTDQKGKALLCPLSQSLGSRTWSCFIVNNQNLLTISHTQHFRHSFQSFFCIIQSGYTI